RKIRDVYVSGSSRESVGAKRGVRRGRVEQWPPDSVYARSERSIQKFAGNSGGERRTGGRESGANAGGTGELPLRDERVGENDRRIERNARSHGSGRKFHAQFRPNDGVGSNLDGRWTGREQRQSGVRGAVGGRRIGGSVRDAGRSTAWRLGIQKDRRGRGRVWEVPVRARRIVRDRARHGCVRCGDQDRGALRSCRQSIN